MASVNRPNAPQDYRTTPALLDAVQARFGRIDFDAACSLDNCVARMGYHYPEYNALERDWATELAGLTVWVNPPFAQSGAFAAKAAGAGTRVLLLVPASVDSRWFERHVHGKALVLPLSPRVTFVGQTAPINRALMLACYGYGQVGFEPWRWRP